jgi:5-methylcytosine-specific restriction endonuclease McrA
VTADQEGRCNHYGDCIVLCDCERARYCSDDYSSCYECFIDRRSEYIACVFCGKWHSPEFDTCFTCRPQGRDEAARNLKLAIISRDSFTCRYCGVQAGDQQVDPRRVSPKNDGVRPAVLHVDHIKPCAKGGTADPWNLQALCGVCNVAKGSEWWYGSRHIRARDEVIAAYLTYLRRFLAEEERDALDEETENEGMTLATAWDLVISEWKERVRHRRGPRQPARGVVTEDVPPEYAHMDLPADGRA